VSVAQDSASATTAATRLSIGFCCAGHLYSHLFMLLYPTVVLVLPNEFNRPYDELLTLATPGFIAFGLFALPAGRLADRWSAFAMMVVFFIGTGVASILTGLAQTPLQIAMGLTLIGVFASIYHPVGIAWVIRHSVNQGMALAVNGVFGNWGLAVAALSAGALIELSGWRAAFIVPGVVCALTGVAFLYFARAGAVAVHDSDRVVHAPASRRQLIQAFSVVAVTALFGGLVFQSTTVGMPKIFDERLGGLVSGTLGVGGLVAMVYFLASFAQLAVGYLMDRYPLKLIYVVVYGLQAPMLFLAASLFDGPLLIVVLIFACLNVGALPVSDMVVARFAPPKWRSTIYGAKFVVVLGVASLGVPMVAYIHDNTGGFTMLFLVVSAFALIVAGAALFLPASRRAEAVAAE
jgi:MFS family permease